VQQLTALLDDLPPDLSTQVVTHASWTERRSDSYTRLAFLGDSVLGLAVTAHLYPRLEAERYGAGRLTKIRAQAVSGPSCRAVAERLRVPERLAAAAPLGTSVAALAMTERVLASITEAIIGACYLHAGYDTTASAVVEAFSPEIEEALEHPVDFKSALQERLAQRALTVVYTVTEERGPAARADVRGRGDRRRGGRRVGVGAIEEERRAGRRARGARPLGQPGRGGLMHLKSITLKGFKSFPDRTKLEFGSGVAVIVGPNGSGKSNVTDAVLWAMGEQSPLAVRGQSMQDVIFGGGRGVQARSSAEVEIVIDNADGAIELPLGEISIVRRLDRSGEGEYRLNGARCRLVDVLELPERHGAGQGDALRGLPGPRGGDRHLQAEGPPSAHRGGRGPGQAPQAPAPGPAQARAHRRTTWTAGST
jgi:ribonuclease-3